MHPPLGQEVHFRADVEIIAKLNDRPVDKDPLSAIQREQEHCEGTEESIR